MMGDDPKFAYSDEFIKQVKAARGYAVAEASKMEEFIGLCDVRLSEAESGATIISSEVLLDDLEFLRRYPDDEDFGWFGWQIPEVVKELRRRGVTIPPAD